MSRRTTRVMVIFFLIHGLLKTYGIIAQKVIVVDSGVLHDTTFYDGLKQVARSAFPNSKQNPDVNKVLYQTSVSTNLPPMQRRKVPGFPPEISVIEMSYRRIQGVLDKYPRRQTFSIVSKFNVEEGGRRNKAKLTTPLQCLQAFSHFLMSRKRTSRKDHCYVDVHGNGIAQIISTKKNVIPVVVTYNYPFLIESEDGHQQFGGAVWELARVFAEKLNLQYDIVYVGNVTGYKTPSGSYTAGLGKVFSGEAEFEITLSALTTQKMTDFDYLPDVFGVSYIPMTFMVKHLKESTSSKLLVALDPFSPMVWGTLGSSTIFTGLAIWAGVMITKKLGFREGWRLLPQDVGVMRNVFYIFGVLINQAGQEIPAANIPRVVGGFWCLSAILFCSIYLQKFTADLIAPSQVVGPKTFKELVDQDYHYFAKSGQMRYLVMSMNTGYGKIIAGTLKNEEEPIWSYEEALKKVRDSHYAMFSTFTQLMTEASISVRQKGECQYWMGDEDFYKSLGSILIRKRSRLTNAMMFVATHLVASGIPEMMRQKYSGERYGILCKRPYVKPRETKVMVNDLNSAYAIAGLGLTISGAAFIAEHIFYQRRKRGSNSAGML